MHCKLPVELVRRHRLGLPCATRRFEFAPRFAAETRLGQHAPNAAAAHLQSLLRQQMLDPARAVGATPLGKIVLHFGLHLLIHFSLSAWWAAEPLVVATARDFQGLT